MSTLTLVRHGQATAFAKQSDRLSELGELQARLLGDYWSARVVTFDAVYCGTLERQRRTAEIVASQVRAAGLDWPDPIPNPAWNEYDANGILHDLVPTLARRNPQFQTLVANAEAARGTPHQNRHFQKMFEVAMAAWISGELSRPHVEPWANFQARVRGAIGELMAEPASRRVAVFTSGGPVGVAVQFALCAPPEKAIEVNWRVRNCSLTEFLYSGPRINLDCFNALPHLPDSDTWSFR